jgi:hypothetical protein
MKLVFLLLAIFSLGIGFLGVFLPVLPTTPFILFSTFLLSKSSEKVYKKLVKSQVYQRYFKDFIENKVMSKKKKWTLLILVDAMLLITYISISLLWIRIIIVVLFLLKHWYFAKYIKAI